LVDLSGESPRDGDSASKSRDTPSVFTKGGGEGISNKHKKCVKKRNSPINLVLSEEVKLHEVVTMVELAMVRWFYGQRIGCRSLRVWVHDQWEHVLGYSPSFSILTKD
jgi:hypothetical protein